VKLRILIASVIVVVAAPLAAQAQGVPGGFVHGVHEGYRIAGPVGAVVGGPVGGVIGGIEGVLGVNHAYQAPPRAAPKRAVRTRARKSRRSRAAR
jgi:hypothetical protein